MRGNLGKWAPRAEPGGRWKGGSEAKNPDRVNGRKRRGRHAAGALPPPRLQVRRSEEHTSELQSLMRISYAVFCLKKKTTDGQHQHRYIYNRQPTHSQSPDPTQRNASYASH